MKKILFIFIFLPIIGFAQNTNKIIELYSGIDGIFTYYLLKKLKETNGNVTLGQLDDYIKKNVSIQSLKINGKNQEPKINKSPNIVYKWKTYQL